MALDDKNMILAVTGHRPGKIVVGNRNGYERGVQTLLTAFARQEIDKLRPALVITGVALGWDQSAAEACIELGVPFDAYVPCDGQSSRWNYEAQDRYEAICSLARDVKIISPGPYASWKMMIRNNAMVDACDVLLALWNGEEDGGTWQCVSQAAKKKKAVTFCWNDWLECAKERVV